jgi:inhibitor of KinA
VELPVCYGGEFGPDLGEVAGHCGLSEPEVIARHSGAEYRVYMLGFAPGFAYLGGLDPAIAAPRRQTPRLKVPAGSVGIAGLQTGIYPLETPGGWQIIGRSPQRLFRPGQEEPCLLKPGDRLRFVPIDLAAYRAISEERP